MIARSKPTPRLPHQSPIVVQHHHRHDVHIHGLDQLSEIKDALMALMSRATLTPELTGSLFPDFADDSSSYSAADTTDADSSHDSPTPSQQTAESSHESPAPKFRTLATCYADLIAARKQRIKEKTQKDHRTSASQFDQWAIESEKDHRCTEPVVFSLRRDDAFESFARHRFADHSNAVTTVGRRLTHIVMIARAMKDAGIIERIPTLPTDSDLKAIRREIDQKSIDEQTAERRVPSADEIDQLARHVTVATYPYKQAAPYFWRGWIRYCALFGPRGRDIVSPDPHKIGLRRQDVVLDSLCPVQDVNSILGRDLHSPHGWVWYYVGKDHTSDSPRVLFPMPKWLRDWLQYFLNRAPGERLFTGNNPDRFLTQKNLSANWNRIVAAADVDPQIRLSEGKGGVIAIRKFAANWWYLQTLQLRNDAKTADMVSQYMLHHAEITVSKKHYLSTQAAVLPIMLELLDSFPLPAADAAPVGLLAE